MSSEQESSKEYETGTPWEPTLEMVEEINRNIVNNPQDIELREFLESNRNVISYAVGSPDNHEVLIKSMGMLSNLVRYRPDTKEITEFIIKDNLDALKQYCSNDTAEFRFLVRSIEGNLLISESESLREMGLEILKEDLEKNGPQSLDLVHKALTELPGNADRKFLEELAKLVDKNKKYVEKLVDHEHAYLRDQGIELCLDCLAGYPDPKRREWVASTLYGKQPETTKLVLNRLYHVQQVPHIPYGYVETVAEYYRDNRPGVRSIVSQFIDKRPPTELALRIIPAMASCYSMEDDKMAYFGAELIKEYLSKCDLGDLAQGYLAAWSGGCEEDMLAYVVNENVKMITELEQESPGIVRRLTEHQGIKHFSRYPSEMLLEQDKLREQKDISYGVLLTPEMDHNGAFYAMKRVYENFYDRLKAGNLEHPHSVRIYERGDMKGVARLVKKVADEYGPMSFAIMGAHGSPSEMAFSNFEGGVIAKSNLQNIKPERHNFFTKDASLVLISCSTGSESNISVETGSPNIANAYSKAFGVKVIAPQEDASIANLVPRFKEDGVDFSVEYTKGKTTSYQPEKK